jgi:hypothetical protein
MELNVLLIVFVLLVHFIADFICQTQWQAENKSKNDVALWNHIGSYTLVLHVSALVIASLTPMTWYMALIWSGVNGLLHFGTDYITSRINSKLWAAGNVHNFFVGIGADQFIHAATLILTLRWLYE